MPGFLTRDSSVHRSLAGLVEAVRLSGLPLEVITLREVNLPTWATGWLGVLVKKLGLMLAHIGLASDIVTRAWRRQAIVREFLLLPVLAVWPLVWFHRRNVRFVVNHNFDWAHRGIGQRTALRLLCRTGIQLICFETDVATTALRLGLEPGRVSVIPHPLFTAPTKRMRPMNGRPVVGVVGNFRAEKGSLELLQQLGAAVRAGEFDAKLFLGTADAHVRADFAAEGWDTADTRSDADYAAALRRCDVLVLNCDRDRYYFRPSGVLSDAVSAGVYVVAPDYPVMRAQLTQPSRVGATFNSPAELVPAIIEAIRLAQSANGDDFAQQFAARRPEQLAVRLREIFSPVKTGAAGEPHRFRVDLTKSVAVWPMNLKIRRGIWQILIKPFYMLLPRRASAVRIAILRLMGARIGRGCNFEQRVDVLMPWNLEVGDTVAIGRDAEIYNYAPVKIGSMTLISQYTYLCTGSHDHTHPHMPLIWKPITIGTECWVAADVFVAPGVTIGDGAVIGARSVVTKNQPAWMVCAGNPCGPVKPRVLRPAASP